MACTTLVFNCLFRFHQLMEVATRYASSSQRIKERPHLFKNKYKVCMHNFFQFNFEQFELFLKNITYIWKKKDIYVNFNIKIPKDKYKIDFLPSF